MHTGTKKHVRCTQKVTSRRGSLEWNMLGNCKRSDPTELDVPLVGDVDDGGDCLYGRQNTYKKQQDLPLIFAVNLKLF